MHVEIAGGEPPTVTDLGSSNGTFVNGARIPPHTPVPVFATSLIEFGEVTLLLKGLGGTAPAGEAPGDAAQRLESLVALVASSEMNLILAGETGVGKGVMATRVHELSPRAGGPFLALSCAALPEAMLEGELFGHERGAFTGAVTSRAGLIESAQGGTVFLDEIGELPLTTQVKLLRVVENREVFRLGDRRPRTVDVRFVSATHRDLERLVADGPFREDLYFRLNGITIEIPPLRARRGEIPPLARRFLEEACHRGGRPPIELTDPALEVLVAYEWPGNVRELRNAMDRAAVLTRGVLVEPECLFLGGKVSAASASLSGSQPTSSGSLRSVTAAASLRDAVATAEEVSIREALERAAGNQTRAARLLGISRRTLLRRLDAHAIERPRKAPDEGDDD
jgi:DNA-binding NtrC family response regulator